MESDDTWTPLGLAGWKALVSINRARKARKKECNDESNRPTIDVKAPAPESAGEVGNAVRPEQDNGRGEASRIAMQSIKGAP